jgi:CheY-like chemotaxis protein
VDDDRFARLGIRVALESLGCETLELDGRGALEPVLRSFDPGVVFLDQQLEDTHGLALAQRIREHDQQLGRARRSVVIISGSSQARSADTTIDGWLVKPASRQALARILAA